MKKCTKCHKDFDPKKKVVLLNLQMVSTRCFGFAMNILKNGMIS